MLARALERIDMVASTGKTALDLAGLGLTELPPEFNRVAAGLLSLDLSGNRLSRVPAQLGLCTALVSLDLGHNQLVTAFGLASPRKLQFLTLRANGFTDFPNEVLELPLLEKLDLSENPIARVPAGISVLARLEVLALQHCRIEALPREVAEMPSLREIPLDGNPLRTPPLEIALRGVEAIRTYFDDLTRDSGPAQSGRNRLLAVAIEQYARTYDPRPGAVSETRALVDVLESRYGYDDVEELYDQQATHNNLLAALDDLMRRTGPADNVIVYFNGWTGDARSASDFFTWDVDMMPFDRQANFLSGMRAKHVLLIVDNHLYGPTLAQERGTRVSGQDYASRWAMFRIGADWDARFTPRLTEFLTNNTLEINAAIAAYSSGAVASPLSIPGDEGGEFGFFPKNEAPANPPPEATATPLDQEKFDFFVGLVRDEIASDRSDSALQLLSEVIAPRERDNLQALSAQLSTVRQQQVRGSVSFETAAREKNRVRATLFDFVDRLTPEHIDLEAIQLQPNTQTRTEAEKEILDAISQKIRQIEDSRRRMSDKVDTHTWRTLVRQMQTDLAELDELQRTATEKFRLDISPYAQFDESLAMVEAAEEVNMAYEAMQAHTIAAYERYLAKFKTGSFHSEIQNRLTELRNLEREEQIVRELREHPSGASIQAYLTTFPAGKYRAEVDQLQARLNAEEDALWRNAETANTVEAYRDYQTKTKVGNYTSLATSRIIRLESETSANRVNEAKLIFVGNGRVGKTSLSRVLAGEAFNPDEPSTHGIRILQWPLKLPDGRQLKLNVWDFGGQEIYHNTHRFFLTTRALYLLVWDQETLDDARAHPDKPDEHEQNFTHEYWLHNVRLLSHGAPVVMVQNKIEKQKSFVDNPSDLAKNFNVKDFCDVSAARPLHVDRLREMLAEQYAHAPGLKELIGYDLPANWLAARRALESLGADKPYVKYDDYLDLCGEHGLSADAARELAAFLHEIGAILYFPHNDLLADIVFLNPTWATGIIYRVLNRDVEAAHGRFTKAELCHEWHDIVPANSRDKFRFRDEKEVAIFLELMQAFEICFELPGQPGSFVAPQFLPRTAPALAWDRAHSLKFGYAYPFLHPGLIARAIVRLSPYATADAWWRDGIAIEKAGTRALIRARLPEKQLRIELQGTNPAGLRDFLIADVFATVNTDMQARAIVFCPACDGAIDHADAERLYRDGEEKIFCPQCRHNVALAAIFEPAARPDAALDKQKIKQLLAHDQIEEALEAMQQHTPDDAILQLARLHRMRDDYNRGLTLGEDRDVVRQRVIKAVLDWLEERP